MKVMLTNYDLFADKCSEFVGQGIPDIICRLASKGYTVCLLIFSLP